MKSRILSALVAITITGPACAAVVNYSTYIATGSADTSWVITTTGVGSANFGGTDVTYGGVDWEGSQTNGHSSSQTYVSVPGFTIYHSIPGFGWANNNDALFYPTNPTVGLLHSGTTVNSSSATIDINGLVIGQQYSAKFVFADSRSSPSGTNMTLAALGANSGTSDSTRYSYTDGQFLVVNATWTASTTGISFRPSIDGGTDTLLNAVQIAAVPEPSAALLSLIAPLALLRRRR